MLLGVVGMWLPPLMGANSLWLHRSKVQCRRLYSFQPVLAEAAEQRQNKVSLTVLSRAPRNIGDLLVHLAAKYGLVNRIPTKADIR